MSDRFTRSDAFNVTHHKYCNLILFVYTAVDIIESQKLNLNMLLRITLELISQAEDGLMVWQKRGLRDSGPYYVTLAGIAVGVTYSLYLIFKMSFPKRQE